MTCFTSFRPALAAAAVLLSISIVAASPAQTPEREPIGSNFKVAAEAFTLVGPGPAESAKPPLQPPSVDYGVRYDWVPESRLGPIDDDSLLAEDDTLAATGDKTLRYGIWRDILVELPDFDWQDVGEAGRLWYADVAATDARGIRLHFRGLKLPEGAAISVFSPEDASPRIWRIERDGWNSNGELWVPTIFCERVRVEYFDPQAKSDASRVPAFTIDAIQHIYRDLTPVITSRVPANCDDSTCFPTWANVAKASAGIGTVNSNSLYCSGTMLNATNNDQTPYWLTANHCLSTASSASSAEIYWLYQTATCNGAAPSIASVPQSAPCTLVSTGTTSDYTLLMIEGTVPRTQIAWAGWASAAVANGTAATCIHHPQGSWKRLSSGTKSTAASCGAGGGHVGMTWSASSNGTEPGSSGSGTFRNDTQQIFGQLHCGPSSCESPSNDDYGAFATTFGVAAVASALAGGSDDALENNDTCATARVTTAGTYGSLIVKNTDEDWYSISVPSGASLGVSVIFTHANGDIDLQLYGTCGGAVLASSTTQTGTETINYTNNGATASFLLRVFLATDTRNAYNMTITVNCPTPAAPTGVAATDATLCTGVRVSWTAAAGASSYQVWRNTTNNSATAVQVGTPTASPFDDTTAIAGNGYFYWVKSVNGCGASGFSTSDAGSRAAPLAAPTVVSATDSTLCDRVSVSWTAVGGASSYEVWRNTINNSATAIQLGSPTTSPFDDATANPSVGYFYWVRALNLCGPSGFSSSDAGSRASSLPGPSGVSASDATQCDRVTITWSGVGGASGYEVWRNTANNSATATLIGSTASTLLDDLTAAPGVSYFYWVKSVNQCGPGAFSAADAGLRAVAPTSPGDVSATDATLCDRVTVSWSADANANSYEVWRNTINDSSTASAIGTPAAPPFDDLSTLAGVAYFYWVKSVGLCGSSDFSASDAGSRCAPCPEDLNGDLLIDLSDLSILLSQFGNSGLNLPGDINNDGSVNLTDLSRLLARFGAGC